MTAGKYGVKKVIDLSDWGRPIARLVARFLKEKPISVIQITNLHLLLAIFCSWLILQEEMIIACALLVVKGVIDAVDGELARIRQRPSHVGRYWDTVADSIGLVSVMVCFGLSFNWHPLITGAIILATLLQYSLFNHYSIMMRSLSSGDITSRLDERIRPEAYPWEKQSNVDIFHSIYLLFFNWQDRIISFLAGKDSTKLSFHLTVSSYLGYGMQSLVILMLALSENLNYLPELILGVNMSIMTLVIVSNRI